jgi:hypothetical protein
MVTAASLAGARPDDTVGPRAFGATVDAATSLEEVGKLVLSGPVAVTRSGHVVGVVTVDVLSGYLRARVGELSEVSDRHPGPATTGATNAEEEARA